MSRASARPLRGLDQRRIVESGFFFFNDTAPTEIYTLSLHDALPISYLLGQEEYADRESYPFPSLVLLDLDRKSTRLNSSHRCISYAVFCLKKNHGRECMDAAGDRAHLAGGHNLARRSLAHPEANHFQSSDEEQSNSVHVMDIFFLINGAPPKKSPFPLPALLRS